VFGFDAKARANYGHASLPLVADAAKALVKQFYGSPIRFSYFVGCSKGGEEGMAFAQRYPAEFDGIAASAPGMSLPRAAVEEAWDTQALASAIDSPGNPSTDRHLAELASTLSDADLALVRDAVLGACDADDGVKDGIVGDFSKCTTAKVQPALHALRKSGPSRASCRARTIARVTLCTPSGLGMPGLVRRAGACGSSAMPTGGRRHSM
jgi:feruloyl esterase